MGLFQPKPYKVLKNGTWQTVTPQPREFIKRGGYRGSNHPQFDLVLLESKLNK